MKEQISQPVPVSRTMQGKSREANTASVTNVLQAYKNGISQRQEIDEDELLQGKFETAQLDELEDEELLQGKFETGQRDELEDDELLQGKFETTQRDELKDDELLQGKFETAQRDELEDDELLQGKFEPTQRQETPNNTGLPDNLKAGVEQLSGLDMSDIKVHYNSSKPASVQAHAYTQGTDIHVAPGQEKHLAHEAWHVTQQKQGRVQPTTTVAGMAVNDNVGLENEADVMGGKAVQMKQEENKSWAVANSITQKKSNGKQGLGFVDNRPDTVAQRKLQEMGQGNSHERRLKTIQKLSINSTQAAEVIQLYWQKNPAGGKPIWVNSPAPEGWPSVTIGNKVVFQSPEEAKAERDDHIAALGIQVARRSHPSTRRRDFTPEESNRLAQLPSVLTREDRDLHEPNRTGASGKKAHLTAKGLHTAGHADIDASEQMDQDSARKGRGNRISSKAPTVGVDRSQAYGEQTVGIKARKLERARLRGKEDAQHVNVVTTDEIIDELKSGPKQTESGKSRGRLEDFARKDREFHHQVGFHSPLDEEHYIPNRFLVRPDLAEIHDSDSESDSDDEFVRGDEERQADAPVRSGPTAAEEEEKGAGVNSVVTTVDPEVLRLRGIHAGLKLTGTANRWATVSAADKAALKMLGLK